MDEAQNEAYLEWLENVFAALETIDELLNPGTGVLYLHGTNPMVRVMPGKDCLAQIEISRVP